jgi:hypothetical protein
MIEGTSGLYIDLRPNSEAPKEDGFIVSIKQDGTPGTVYHIASVRLVKARNGRQLQRYMMRVYKAPDMLPFVHYNKNNGTVWVKDQQAIRITWYRR